MDLYCRLRYYDIDKLHDQVPPPGRTSIPQNPLSRPIEKQELSWFKVAESACGRPVVAICGRVFIAKEGARQKVGEG